MATVNPNLYRIYSPYDTYVKGERVIYAATQRWLCIINAGQQQSPVYAPNNWEFIGYVNSIGITSVAGINSVTAATNASTGAVTIQLVNDAATPGNSKYYGTDSGGTRGFFALPGGGGSPGGSDMDVQYNKAGTFGGDNNFLWDYTNLNFTVGDLSSASAQMALSVDNQIGTISLESDLGSIVIAGSLGTYTRSPNNGLIIDNKNGHYTLGNQISGGTYIDINNATGLISFNVATNSSFATNAYYFPIGKGTNGQTLITDASGVLSWQTPSAGTVTSASVVTANGFAGTVATSTTTPAITISTTITGILQGNGTAISAATLGNLTDVGTDGITIGNGTGVVIGSGTTISQHVADTTHNGYLSSTDWNTFNGKSTVLPSALTKTDDTNVTLTLGGTPSTALLQATSITAGWTGTLSPTRGGTGANNSASTGVAQWNAGSYSASTALANGTTATTQSVNDNSTKIGTTAYIDNTSYHDGHICFSYSGYSSITQGTWALITDTTNFTGNYIGNTSSTQNDQINFIFGCSAGTYSFSSITNAFSNRAIVTVLIDGVSVGTFDGYAASAVFSRFTLTGISITAGQHTISFKAATRNASATGWVIIAQQFELWRTA